MSDTDLNSPVQNCLKGKRVNESVTMASQLRAFLFGWGWGGAQTLAPESPPTGQPTSRHLSMQVNNKIDMGRVKTVTIQSATEKTPISRAASRQTEAGRG